MITVVYSIILFLLFFGYDILFAYYCRKQAIKKNRDKNTWTILGFLFGIISYIILTFLSKLKEPPTAEEQKINWIATPGIILGIMYLLYSIISIILSFLDRTYADIEVNFLFFILGIVFITLSIAFKNRQKWGWFGYTILLVLVAILAIQDIDIYKIILGILALGTFAFAVSPSIRKLYFTN